MDISLFTVFFLIFSGSAVLASIALFTRQPLIIAYIIVGVVLGPYGTHVITDLSIIKEMSHIGIVFLLFLLGLDMQPHALQNVLRKVASTVIISSVLFAFIGTSIGYLFGFTVMESIVLGIAFMFSSTIIGIKLLPTTVLHHRHIGEMMIGTLLCQDIIAIVCLLVLLSGVQGKMEYTTLAYAMIALPLISGFAYLFVRYILLYVIRKFDRFHEFIFLIAIGWCLGLASLAEALFLSAEIGAFIAGISLATSPIAKYIALNLKPLRDFFLVLFFFALGAQLNIDLLPELALATIVIVCAVLTIKPLTFHFLLKRQKEKSGLAWDMGFRLGQISEFSLLVAYVAFDNNLIGERASLLIQAATIITFVVSTYIVIFNFPSPIAVNDKLRRD